MWKSCSVVLDVPLTLFGFEFPDDLIALIGLLMVNGLAFENSLYSIGCTVACGFLLYYSKRGKAPGQVLHVLHTLELPRLPGLVPARQRRYDVW